MSHIASLAEFAKVELRYLDFTLPMDSRSPSRCAPRTR
jgi:hypothetical protein